MVTLLRRLRRASRDATPDVPEVEVSRQVSQRSAGSNRFMLLVPEGGFSYRLLAFPAKDAAQAYIHTQAPELLKTEMIAFWAMDSESVPDSMAASTDVPEAVVMIRNPARPGVVQLYSFVDMEGAQSFLRESAGEELDLRSALTFWAARTDLDMSSPGPYQLPTEQIVPEAPGLQPMQPRSPARSRAADTVADWLAEDARADASPGEEAASPVPEKSASQPPTGILARIHAWPGWDGLAARMVAASLLKPETYDELKRDAEATGRARLIVFLGAFAAGIGAFGSGPAAVLWHSSGFLLGWAAYFGSVYFVSVWVLGGRRDSFLRFFQAAGLATSPAVLLIFGALPSFGLLFPLAASVWMAAATAIAATSVLELYREWALLAAVVGWCPFFAISQVAPALVS